MNPPKLKHLCIRFLLPEMCRLRILQIYYSGSQKSNVGLGNCVPFRDSEGRSVSLLFLASKGHLHVLTCSLLLQFLLNVSMV